MSQSVCVWFVLALVVAAVVVITIPGFQGDTCDGCECKLTNVDILNQLIDESISQCKHRCNSYYNNHGTYQCCN